MQKNDDKLVLHMVTTDKGFFITDFEETTGVNYKYGRSKLERLLVNNSKPKPTYAKNWFLIDDYPESVQEQQPNQRKDKYWELIDKDMESKALPLTKQPSEIDFESPLYELYDMKYDVIPGKLVDVPFEVKVVTEVKNFTLPPKVDFKALAKEGFDEREIIIDNTNFEHQLLDKLIIPEILIHEYPCKLSSDDFYKIIRRHVKANIDNKHAKISSDYEFCFSVNKIVPTVGPAPVSHKELMSSKFKEKTEIIDTTEFRVFEMTNADRAYKGYTVIPEISANSEEKLNKKIQKFLDNLMKVINAPTGEEYK